MDRGNINDNLILTFNYFILFTNYSDSFNFSHVAISTSTEKSDFSEHLQRDSPPLHCVNIVFQHDSGFGDAVVRTLSGVKASVGAFHAGLIPGPCRLASSLVASFLLDNDFAGDFPYCMYWKLQWIFLFV